jgi:hypothetical protein
MKARAPCELQASLLDWRQMARTTEPGRHSGSTIGRRPETRDAPMPRIAGRDYCFRKKEAKVHKWKSLPREEVRQAFR